MTHEAGKGDTQRPTDHKAFSNNYDLIWGNKHDKKANRPVDTIPESEAHATASESKDDPS